MTDLEAIHAGDDRELILEVIGEQAVELHDQPKNTMTCPCGNEFPLRRMFQCFYCEIWFCPRCAEDHFE